MEGPSKLVEDCVLILIMVLESVLGWGLSWGPPFPAPGVLREDLMFRAQGRVRKVLGTNLSLARVAGCFGALI